MSDARCDVLIVGGGVGGCAAAMAAGGLGFSVIMTEPTDWIGGQLTSQAVPPDEHPWIESFGCTARYRRYREGIRKYYRTHYPLTPEARRNDRLNPGNGWVSRLCYEPRVGVMVLDGMLAPMRALGRLQIWNRHEPIEVASDGDRVRSVRFRCLDTGEERSVEAKYVLDASELGDLLPMSGAEYVSGAESQRQTGEPHAPEAADPEAVQGITWCFAMGYDPEEQHTVERPEDYDFWRAYKPNFWPGPLLGWETIHAHTMRKHTWQLFGSDGKLGLFEYRRVLDPALLEPSATAHPATIVNWPQNDYFLAPIHDVPAEETAKRLRQSKQLSLSLLYWLQTEAPRPDGGTGYPGLYLRPDITGTDDGFAMAPYIRESRRMRTKFTVLEQHVSAEANPGKTVADSFPDSVGIGCYRIDLHPDTAGNNTIDFGSLPFEIPLGSLIPVRMRNLLPACKNLGVTHITNGCYRLHPVEWNIGEAAGALASYCIREGVEPYQVSASPDRVADFQSLLVKQGFELHWPRLGPV